MEEPTVAPEAKPVEGKTFAETLTLTGDTAKDLAAIAAEQGISGVTDVQASGEIITQATAQPAQQPQAAEQPIVIDNRPKQDEPPKPVEVPDKFKNPDGTVDKVAKSEQNIDLMIARYKAKEREAQQLQNRVNNPQFQPQQVQSNQYAQPAQQVQPQMLTPLEIQMAQDLIAESTQYGKPMEQAHAIALARVQARTLAARYEADLQNTRDLRQRLEDAERTRELQGLITSDSSLATPEMVDKLWQIRQDKPWINNSAEPWKEAYIYYRGMQGQAKQVSAPIPTRATAPQVPVGPVSRVQSTVDVSNPNSLTNEQLIAEIRKFHPSFRG